MAQSSFFALIAAVLLVTILCGQQADANGASCQLYGHSCLGGHGKRSSSAPMAPQSAGTLDTDAAVDAAAAAAFQAKMNSNRLSNVLRDMISRRMMATAALRMQQVSPYDLEELEKRNNIDYPAARK